ncbi:MAG: twin-arginine translocase TatA/TatE family subunit [Kiloniellales bacterium]
MGTFSIWHWLIVLVVVLVLFGGGGKLSKLMGDAGRGINAFKKGLKEQGDKSGEAEEQAEVASQRSIEQDEVERKDKTAASG